MRAFSLWKRIKKRLQRDKRPAWQLAGLLTAILSVTCMAPQAAAAGGTTFAGVGTFKPGTSYDVDRQGRASLIETLREGHDPLAIELRRIYLCGEERQQLGEHTAAETIELLQRHPRWSATLSKDGIVIVEERINDLSPACKESAVFGIDQDGRLSLFDGPPERNKVLRTFYQLDVNSMESSLPKEQFDELQRGIRVSDVDELNSILSSYSDYALPEKPRAMKPAALSYAYEEEGISLR